MISLNSEPLLGSMVLSRDAVWKKTYRPPNGMTFPGGTTASVKVTDRDGGDTLATFTGTVDTALVTFKEDGVDHADIPAGANFEMFVDIPSDGTYKVQYGRVVRRDPFFR